MFDPHRGPCSRAEFPDFLRPIPQPDGTMVRIDADAWAPRWLCGASLTTPVDPAPSFDVMTLLAIGDGVLSADDWVLLTTKRKVRRPPFTLGCSLRRFHHSSSSLPTGSGKSLCVVPSSVGGERGRPVQRWDNDGRCSDHLPCR